MEKLRRVIAGLLAAGVLFICAPAANAVSDDFADLKGHWAEETVRKAADNGLISGYGDGNIGPDDPITKAQICAVLTRVLGAVEEADTTPLGLSGDEWYAQAAARALRLGIISPDETDLNRPLTRLSAFCMLAEAFQLAQADPDLMPLSVHEEAQTLTREQKKVIASLLSAGLLKGSDSGLMLSKTISRAEFLTVLGHLTERYEDGLPDGARITGGAVVSLSGILRNISADRLWLGCGSSSVEMASVNADLLVLRSDSPGSVSMSGAAYVDRLVLASRAEKPLTLSVNGASMIKTVVIGTGSGDVTVSGAVKNAEVTGDGRNLTITAPYGTAVYDKLIISGDGCRVTVPGNVTIKSAVISGRDAALVVEGTIEDLRIEGRGASVSGSGTTKNVRVLSSSAALSTGFTTLVNNSYMGIQDAVVSLSAVNAPAAGEPLALTARIEDAGDGTLCTAYWYEDGRLISRQETELADGKTELELLLDIEYKYGMDTDREYTLCLTYTTETGEKQVKTASTGVCLTNFGEEYYAARMPVSSGYEGDYTTQWAIDNDYPAFIKENFVNRGGWSSTTGYLIWISTSGQHVNVFAGSAGNWKLARSFLCSTGTELKPSPQGVFTVYGVLGRWVFSEYWVTSILGFYFGSDYAFHTRPYKTGTYELYDESIGFPSSHGCIRMYDEDVNWLIKNIPVNTTVVSY
ncbi:MAG: L,D-transpeptidase family protein [Clostridiales bacterium]|nr:L,D-transpeptidase family protein [Clostridiales bacterium]